MRFTIPLCAAVAVSMCVATYTPRELGADPLPDSCLTRIQEYNQELARARRAKRPHSLEPLHARARRVRTGLLTPSDASFAPLYLPSDEEFAALRLRMPTFILDREIYERAEARQDSMIALVRRVGAPADTAYWLRIQSFGETGCSRFGSGQLVAAYSAWTTYRKRFPGNYVADVTQRIDGVTRELVEGTCACGDSLSVIAEFQTFIKRFPRDKLVPRVRERMRDVRAGRAQMRYHCAPG